VLECLFHVASADGILHPGEDKFLETVSDKLGLSRAEYRAVRRAFVFDPDSPYEVLGISPGVTDQDLKLHYRELVKSHHPDTLVAKGVPAEFLNAAHRRLAAINAAYDAILAERGQRAERALEKAP
jgi:DnaJ like chaperone protein